MKRTVLIIILGIITVGCIVYGSYKHIYKDNIRWFDSDGNLQISFGEGEDDTTSDGHFAETLSDFSKIKVNVAVAAIEIKEGNSFRIESAYNRESLKPEYSIEGDTLEVSQNKKRSRVGDHSVKLLITVPAGTYLDSVDIKSNVGDIEIEDLRGKKLFADVNVGEISAREIDFEEIEFDTNVGEISAYLAGGNLDDYDMSLSADVGEVSVDGRTHKKEYNSKGNGSRSLKIDANVGAIKVR